MAVPPPPSLVEHPRAAREIAALLEGLLDDAGFGAQANDPLRAALVQIAARYGEIVTQAMNAAADRHLDSFAELLGRPGRTAAAARVHVSFRPSANASSDPVPVRAHTQIAGQPTSSAPAPIFETLAPIELVRAELMRAVFVDAGHRRFAELDVARLQAGLEQDVTARLSPLAHELHLAHAAAFAVVGLQRLRLRLDLQAPTAPTSDGRLEWLMRTPKGAVPLQVTQDTTHGLTRSGEVEFVLPQAWPRATVAGIESRWLTLRCTPEATAPCQSPRLSAVNLEVFAALADQHVVAAYHDGVKLDVTKDFFPFGEMPRFGSVFQLNTPAFDEPGASVELHIELTNPADAQDAPIPPVSIAGRPTVVWEISTAAGFRSLAVTDTTNSLTRHGMVAFVVPENVAATTIAGQNCVWLRARLVSGEYGRTSPAETTGLAVPRAPAVRLLKIQSSLRRGPLLPEHMISDAALTRRRLDSALPSPVDAFPTPDIDGPALYIGLGAMGAPDQRSAFAKSRTINWYVRPRPAAPPLALSDTARRTAMPRWQMRSDVGWCDTALRDDTAGFTRAGIVTTELPDMPGLWEDTSLDATAAKLAWIRMVWPMDTTPGSAIPVPVGLALNSVAAQHTQLLRNEILGSSNGRLDQVFRALRTPIIGAVRLQVREDGEDWSDWNEVDTLAASRGEDRHFAFDRSTGDVRFGDGRHGAIPPSGPNNIRLTEYRTGGGRSGNQPAGAIAQLRSAVPAVEAVSNPEPAAGGVDAEGTARGRARASAWLRHRERAVCADDFAALALAASSQVARAFCQPLSDVRLADVDRAAWQPGDVSVVIIPDSTDAQPQPSLDLLQIVAGLSR